MDRVDDAKTDASEETREEKNEACCLLKRMVRSVAAAASLQRSPAQRKAV